MSLDTQLQQAVLAGPGGDPSETAAPIRVTAYAGVATLSGPVETFAGKHAAETPTRRVRSLKAVDVSGISEKIRHALHRSCLLDDRGVTATSDRGNVHLTGAVPIGVSIRVQMETETLVLVIPGLDPGIASTDGGRFDPRIKSGDDEEGGDGDDGVVRPARGFSGCALILMPMAAVHCGAARATDWAAPDATGFENHIAIL
jgi:BON domain